jgi:uncharacterized protein YrrD
MNTDDRDDERPLAWIAILDRTPVYSSDGQRVGTISEVLGSEDEDVFHGIEVSEGILGRTVLIPAVHVSDITNKRITTDLPADAIRSLPEYQSEQSFQLGFVGLFRRRLGWVQERRDSP